METGTLAAIALHYHGAFLWLARSWSDTTYESWGFLPLLLLVPGLLRPPARRERPSTPHLLGLVGLALLDLACARLRLNVLSAVLGLTSLHLWAVAFRAYSGRWYLQRQLLLALLCLPTIYWANVLFGFHLQHLASSLAASGLGLYGLPVTASGTLLQLPGASFAVDTSCSGLKLLHGGLLFGLLAAPACRPGLARLGFWAGLLSALLLANVVRVMSLAVAHLYLGRPVGEVAHQAIGLVAFAMACGACLLLLRRLRSAPPAARPRCTALPAPEAC